MTAPTASVSTRLQCLICDEFLVCRWTDTHGVGACRTCGAPYTIYHYSDHKRLPNKAPESLLIDGWVPLLRRYWQEHHRNVDPGAFNFPGSTYEVATQEDVGSINLWMEAHKDEIPV